VLVDGTEPAALDTSTPNIARMYDYFLDGKDNFAADREAARQLIEMMPQLPLVARANRAFLRRVVRTLATEYGIRQFIDIGAGLPTAGNVHEVAQKAAPGARVLYVDNDPVVCSHGRALLAGDTTRIIDADLRRPDEILTNPLTKQLIDFGQPFALMFMSVLHFVPDSDDPKGVIARFREVMAPGSFLVISHGTLETHPGDPRAKLSGEVYSQSAASLALRSLDGVRALFDGFELVDPGLVWISDWRPNPFEDVRGVAETLRGGAGRKSG
jgi:hypothetical protein